MTDLLRHKELFMRARARLAATVAGLALAAVGTSAVVADAGPSGNPVRASGVLEANEQEIAVLDPAVVLSRQGVTVLGEDLTGLV
ncbi:hypothetical protein AB0L50_35315 [Streptomyces flaveolus]|uniref:hypothetical protein n=1 Tax=Streptomyces flaveolus TaxID=67297 RepID=UPI003432DC59